MKSTNGPSICAVIITYHPDPAVLELLLDACKNQVSALVIVDNGSTENELGYIRRLITDKLQLRYHLLELGENLGLASAQNCGVAWARKHAYSHILFLDQDSIPSASMVRVLQEALIDLTHRGIPVAGVGPQLIDRRTGKSTPFIKINWFGITRKYCDNKKEHFHETDFLVSSGTLIPMVVFDKVGLSEEGLFIDNVDMEWCFRARSLGFVLYGICDATLQHSVGDRVYRVGPLAIYRHNPVRQYYIMRNRLLLYRREYTPIAWVLQDAFRGLIKILLFTVFFSPRRKNISMMYKGIKDAFAGRTGRYRE